MGKRTASEGLRSRQRQKHKEMFTELATHQQVMIQEQPLRSRSYARRSILQDSQEQIELQVLEHENKDLDGICQAVHKLLSKNKISTKNAFDIPLIDLQQLPDFKDSLQNEHAWKRLSSTLQSDYRIYAYRVDAIHSITYNILNSMSRRQQDIDNLQPDRSAEQDEGRPLLMMKINQESLEGEYLERKIQNLNLVELEVVTRMDPVLERTKRQFDQLGASSMMLDSLQLDQILCLQLVRRTEGLQKYPPWGTYSDSWSSLDPLMAFQQLSRFRHQIHESIDGRMLSQPQFDDQAMALLLFAAQKENHPSFLHTQSHQPFLPNKRHINDEIRFKYPTLKHQQEIGEDAQNWMQDIDRKFLGIKGGGGANQKNKEVSQQQNHIKHQNWVEDPEDIVDFLGEGEGELNKNVVFRPDPDKLEHKEDIEDKFLLTVKMANPFNPAQRTFLKEDWAQPIEDCENNPEQIREEVDVRRQMVSIIQAKKQIKQQIHPRSTFQSIYQNYSQDHQISPALCFLTILHLANECDLNLKEIDPSNFYITT